MKKVFILLISISLMISGCDLLNKFKPIEKERTPLEVYELFRQACYDGDLATAESYVTEKAIYNLVEYSVCHEYLHNGIELTLFGEIEDPYEIPEDLTISGNTAYLKFDSWSSTVTMYLVDGNWKIDNMMLFTH